jgi:hypothetical protein
VPRDLNGVRGLSLYTQALALMAYVQLWLAEMSSAENGLILSGPSVNFEPAFFLWIESACP